MNGRSKDEAKGKKRQAWGVKGGKGGGIEGTKKKVPMTINTRYRRGGESIKN